MKKKSLQKILILSIFLIAIVSTVSLLLQAKQTEIQTIKNTDYGTYSDPEVAYQECYKILTELSLNLNEGLESNKVKNK
ncbi:MULTISPECIES: hypothetical protein [unclassified Myroides]|uniref:hypothetical protein n=1 Tax=unclassified Myroides TaxID=2642485 RepID=UPI0031018CEE